MQDSLRLVFIFVGIIAIGALLIHGYFSNRKNRYPGDAAEAQEKSLKKTKAALEELEPGFDADGVGKVRTVSSTNAKADILPLADEPVISNQSISNPNIDMGAAEDKTPPLFAEPQQVLTEPAQRAASTLTQATGVKASTEQTAAESVPVLNNSFSALDPDDNKSTEKEQSASSVSSNADKRQEYEEELKFAPPPQHLLKTGEQAELVSGTPASNPPLSPVSAPSQGSSNQGHETRVKPAAQSATKPATTPATMQPESSQSAFAVKKETVIEGKAGAKPLSEPVQAKKLAATEADKGLKSAKANSAASVSSAHVSSERASSAKVTAKPQDVYILNVAAREGAKLEGAKLLPALLRLGFKFGDMDIFHRHQDAAGNGPILFSLANMVKPGIFNPDTMEQFSTQGISLFLSVPCPGSASGNFKLMLQAAQKLAKALDAQLLDQHRNPLNDQAVRHTLNKVLEFERQQLLGGKRS